MWRNLAIAAVLLLAGSAAWAASRRTAEAAPDPAPDVAPAPAPDPAPAPEAWTFPGWGFDLFQLDQPQTDGATVDQQTNLRAFLSAIAWAEGTEGQPDPYRVCYAYRHVIRDLSEHPAVSGEWLGERLPDAMCKAAGFGPGCKSTAAGRYQIIKPTWERVADRLGLLNFSPDSQDRAAVELLRECNALDAVMAGRVELAVSRCRRVWASLPGSGWGQPERRAGHFVAKYESAGGVVIA